MLLTGEIKGFKEGCLWVALPISQTEYEQIKSSYKASVVTELEDGRQITAQQRKKIYVLIRCIAEWQGYTPSECMKELLKYDFISSGIVEKITDGCIFSLSNTDRTTARLFITWLIEFCLTWDIPCGEPFWKLCEDVPKFVWTSAIHKRCAVCGKKAELHHFDSVGSGRNRKEICHIGMRCLPLCRSHHTEIHNIGRDSFCNKYILEPVEIDERIADVFKLKK